MNTDETNTDDAGELPPGVRVIDFRVLNWVSDPEEAHAEALEIEAEREEILDGWDEYSEGDELEDIFDLIQSGHMAELRVKHGLEIPPSRSEYHAAIKRRNPSAVVSRTRAAKADQLLFHGEPTGFGLACCDSDGNCTVNDHPNGGCDDCNGGPGRGLYVKGKWGLIFGPQEVGKTWHMARAIKDALDRGCNAIHYEYDDDPGAMPERLRLMGMSRTLINRRLLVIADHCETETDASGKRKPKTPNVPQEFADEVAVVTLDAVTPAAVALGLDSSGDVLMNSLAHALIEPFLLGHSYYGDPYPQAYGIISDHSGHDNPERPKNSAQKLAAVRSVAYQFEPVSGKPSGVGRVGSVRLRIRKDRQSVHVGKSNGDAIGYMDIDGRDGVAVTIHDLAPDKRSSTPAKRGRSASPSLGEIKAAIHEWLAEQDDRTAGKEEIVRGLVGKTKRDGSAMDAKEIRVNLGRVNPTKEPFAKLSDNRFKAL